MKYKKSYNLLEKNMIINIKNMPDFYYYSYNFPKESLMKKNN